MITRAGRRLVLRSGGAAPRRRLSLTLLAASLLAAPLTSHADDDAHHITAQLDLRLVATDVEPSFPDGGLGLGRFDDNHEGLRLGRAFIDYRGRLADTLDLNVTLDTYADNDKNPVDLTEAYLEWRPYPSAGFRWRTRIGAFYPPVSLENRGPGWQSVYSLSPSAINTWIGEEVRTIGGEVSVTWLGTRLGHSFDVSAVAAIYEWNDPLGVLIFSRGWGIHDRQTALFGRLPKAFAESTARRGIEFFHEIDDRPGYYVGLQASAYDRFVIRALHYDNRGDPGASNGYENAWLSRFDSAGLRFTFARDWTFIGQWMAGDTSVGASADGRGFLIMDYDSWFGLLSYEFGRSRLTARYDNLYTDMSRGEQFFDAYQDADAWTLAYMLDFNEHWQIVAEALRVVGSVEQRTYIGAEEDFTEKTFQLAVRYTF